MRGAGARAKSAFCGTLTSMPSMHLQGVHTQLALHCCTVSAAFWQTTLLPGKACCLSAWLHLQERLYLEGPLCSSTAFGGADTGRHSYSGRMELSRGQLSDLLLLMNPASSVW